MNKWWELITKNWQLALGAGLVLVALILLAIFWPKLRGRKNILKNDRLAVTKAAEDDIEHIFNESFREELRNRGRLHFEKILNENAMFLQQDLRLTSSQLNDYMKTEIARSLKTAFTQYEQSIASATNAALDAIGKTQDAIEQQRQVLSQQLAHELSSEKARLLEQFERNMAEIINHYVVTAIGNQIDLSDQLDFILGELQANKQAIVDDIKTGA